MGKWIVNWVAVSGEVCSEEFNSKSDAQNFIQYNDWQRGEHPKLEEVDE